MLTLKKKNNLLDMIQKKHCLSFNRTDKHFE